TMRSWRHAKYYLHKYFVPAWGHRPAGKITEREAAALIAHAVKGEPSEGKPIALKYGAGAEVRKWGSMLFGWALTQRRVKTNPFRNVRGPKIKPRQRFLTIAEARAVWTAAGALPSPWQEAVRLLMLTACREREICGAKRQWLDSHEGALLIPPTYYKTGRSFM